MAAKSLLSPAARRPRARSRPHRCDLRYPMQPAEHRTLEMRCLCRPKRRPPASESSGPPATRGAPGWPFSLAAGSGDDHGQREWCSPASGVSGFRGCPFTRFRATMLSVGPTHNGPRIEAGHSRPGRQVRGDRAISFDHKPVFGVSGFRVFPVSDLRRFLVSRFLCYPLSMFAGILLTGFPAYRIAGFRVNGLSCSPDFMLSLFLTLRVPRLPGFRVADFPRIG